MKTIFGGKFESALVRGFDEISHGDRNASTHPYYAGLNRKVAKSYADRCGTFAALAERVLVPSIDWSFRVDEARLDGKPKPELGLEQTKAGGGEWDTDTRKFVNFILRTGALSVESRRYISQLQFDHYPPDMRAHLEKDRKQYEEGAAEHYLCRLFLHVRAAGESGAFLVLSEEDIRILSELGQFILATRLPVPFAFPDVPPRLIEPEAFCNGILNFAPPDIFAVSAVRADPEIREYAVKIGKILAHEPAAEREEKMLAAMVAAHEKSEKGRRVEKIFEAASWVVKPLHYVPVVGEIVGAAEDIKDLAMRWVARGDENLEWHLLGVRMADVAIKDYLNRKANMIRAAG